MNALTTASLLSSLQTTTTAQPIIDLVKSVSMPASASALALLQSTKSKDNATISEAIDNILNEGNKWVGLQQRGEPGWFSKTILRAKSNIEAVRRGYKSFSARITEIQDKIDVALAQEYANIKTAYEDKLATTKSIENICMAQEAITQRLAQLGDTQLQDTQLVNYKNFLEMALDDLARYKLVAVDTLAECELVSSTAYSTIYAIDTKTRAALASFITLSAKYIQRTNTRDTLTMMENISKATEDLRLKNAQMTRENMTLAATHMTKAAVSTSSLEAVSQEYIAAISEVKTIFDDAKRSREADAPKLAQLEAKVKAAFNGS